MTENDFELDGDLNTPDSIADVLSSAFSEDSTEATEAAEEPKEPEAQKEEQKPQETSEEEQRPAESSAGATEPASSEAPAPSTAPEPKVPTDAELARASMETIAKLQAQTAELQKQLLEAQKTKSAEKEEPVESAEETVFKQADPKDYHFNISDKLYGALYGEDVPVEQRKAALAAFATGIAMTTRDQLMSTFGAWVKQNFDAVPRVVNYLANAREQTRSSSESIRNDFFTKFPDLNKPELAPFIKATISQVQTETKATNWTPQFRDLVGERVQSVLKAYAQIAAPKVVVPPAPKAAATIRPAVPVADPNSADEIFATLNTSF